MNIVVLKGNLTRDPETRFTAGGTAVCDIGLAVNRVWVDDAGEKKEEVSFFNCTSFGRTAENIGQYFNKGKPILISGRLKMDQWDDKQTGQKRTAIKIVIERFDFCGESNASQTGDTRRANQGRPATQSRQAQAPAPATDSAPLPAEDDDVPF